MQAQTQFRSIEAVEPTTITVDADRLVVAQGDRDQATRMVPLADIERVKVRVLLGIATLVLKTKHQRTIIVDLLLPEDARAAAELIERRAAAAELSPDAAVA